MFGGMPIDYVFGNDPLQVGRRSLFTATLVIEDHGDLVALFYACHASSPSAVLANLARRVTSRHLAEIRIVRGVDADDETVLRLLPSRALKRLEDCGDLSATAQPLAAGGELQIVERIDGVGGRSLRGTQPTEDSFRWCD